MTMACNFMEYSNWEADGRFDDQEIIRLMWKLNNYYSVHYTPEI
jgi:hypothetical protein